MFLGISVLWVGLLVTILFIKNKDLNLNTESSNRRSDDSKRKLAKNKSKSKKTNKEVNIQKNDIELVSNKNIDLNVLKEVQVIENTEEKKQEIEENIMMDISISEMINETEKPYQEVEIDYSKMYNNMIQANMKELYNEKPPSDLSKAKWNQIDEIEELLEESSDNVLEDLTEYENEDRKIKKITF